MTRIWQGLLIIGIATMIYLIAGLLTEKPYDLDYDFIRPSQPWERLIWDVKAEGP